MTDRMWPSRTLGPALSQGWLPAIMWRCRHREFLGCCRGGNKLVLLTNTLAAPMFNYSVANQDTTSASIFDRVSVPVSQPPSKPLCSLAHHGSFCTAAGCSGIARRRSHCRERTSQPASVVAAASAGTAPAEYCNRDSNHYKPGCIRGARPARPPPLPPQL